MPSEPVALKPTQDDRKAAAPIMKHLYGNHDATGADTLFERAVLRGDYDYHYIIQAFAAHRTPPASEPPRPVDGDGLVEKLEAQIAWTTKNCPNASYVPIRTADATQAAAHIAHTAGLMEEARELLELYADDVICSDCEQTVSWGDAIRTFLAKLEAQGHVHRQA